LVSKLHRAGCVFVETPVHHYPRIHGDSQFFTFGRVLSTAVDFSRLWWRMITTTNRRNVRNQTHQIAS
jgi:hypothetical protein